ncbi:trimeric intracellular cation channel family protein [Rhodobacteraceae bacterium 2376]|uniref:Trimeric intracellular cation channel family protein n=1 Tax=Rhabdonatronobacter sediminivivens TaxID=2743469 RepID=A0A7Z0HXN7_9RHOB|nr:trimeric intracellular cation channel family protein [Rhabdonatronobacter sediminivivens]NYS24204.1 trimeric intracellular cation channel family protein [Rhabdonatronobacter sediminivivens]
MSLLQWLDYAAVFVFAVTGALAASRAQLDIVGFLFLGCLTAVGGGTLRDMILGRDQVFWVADPGMILSACLAAVLVFFTAHLLESRLRALEWFDAMALSVAVPAGVGVALGMGQDWPIVLIMGVATGTFGGLMRDVVANEVPLILKQGQLYATAALAGAGVAVLADTAGGPQWVALLSCAAVTFALRAGSMAFGWCLPVYKSRPPRR